jgi:hypothetical protein
MTRTCSCIRAGVVRCCLRITSSHAVGLRKDMGAAAGTYTKLWIGRLASTSYQGERH